MRRQGGTVQSDDPVAAQTGADHAVVIEHRNPVRGQPDVALQTRGSEAEGESERLQRVLGGVGTAAAVGEGDGRVDQRRQRRHG